MIIGARKRPLPNPANPVFLALSLFSQLGSTNTQASYYC